MRYWGIVEPFSGEDTTPVYSILSEQEIIEEVFDFEAIQFLVYLGYIPTLSQVVDEWIIVNWAWELK